jgi:hypothetical protein
MDFAICFCGSGPAISLKEELEVVSLSVFDVYIMNAGSDVSLQADQVRTSCCGGQRRYAPRTCTKNGWAVLPYIYLALESRLISVM